MVPNVSVIVPIYNMEKLLTSCLESILGQTLIEIEIILVNDGSKDNSGEIADAYASRDDRIKVIHKKNGGVSSARNAGLAIATGQYIGFVDPDDWISEDMYQKLYDTAAKGNLDIVICHNYNHHIEKGNFEIDSFHIKENTLRNIRRHTLKDDYFSAVWNMIFKKSLIDEINSKFPENFTVWEDGYFVLKAMYFTDRVKYLNEPYYHYRKTYKKQRYINNLFESLLFLQQVREQCVKKWGINVFNEDECIEALFCKRIVLCLEQEMNINRGEIKHKNIKKIINHPSTLKAFSQLKKSRSGYKQIGWPAYIILQFAVFKKNFLIIWINTILNIFRKFKNFYKPLMG
ncbi:glycosyltransferase [Neobacillus niacini]|uniref:glycosyltransferase n=1 Tax=Neobacillus niacini TaxID=86668 RepID=UPI003000AB6D